MEWELRRAKAIARSFLIEQLKEQFPNRQIDKYLGLPAAEAIFENLMLCDFKIDHMDLVDKDVEVIRKAAKAINCHENARSFRFWARDVDEVIISLNYCAEYDFVWLDYCGPITPERLNLLKNIIKASRDDALIAVTYMACRETTYAQAIMNLFEDAPLKGLRDPELPTHYISRARTVVEVAKLAGKPLRVKVLPYRDTATSPMLLFVFRKGVRKTTVEVLPLVTGENDD